MRDSTILIFFSLKCIITLTITANVIVKTIANKKLRGSRSVLKESVSISIIPTTAILSGIPNTRPKAIPIKVRKMFSLDNI